MIPKRIARPVHENRFDRIWLPILAEIGLFEINVLIVSEKSFANDSANP
jgi:hypothetical protein